MIIMAGPFDNGGNSRSRSSGRSGSGKQDIKNYIDKIQQKEFTYRNAGDFVEQYFSKKANIETIAGEKYQEAEKAEEDMREYLENEQYQDEGYVREITQQKAVEAMEAYKNILQWRELQVKAQEILLKKETDLVEQMSGLNKTEDVMEEIKEVFDTKYESEKEKLKVLKKTFENKMESRTDSINERIDQIEKREREQLRYTAQQVEVLNDILNKIEANIEADVEKLKVPESTAKKIDEEVDHDIDEDMMENHEEDEDQDQITVQEEEESEVEVPEDWGDEENETKFGTSPESVDDPEFGFTESVSAYEVEEREWQVLRALDKGITTKSEIRNYWDTNLMAFPMQQVNTLVRKEVIDHEDLPESIEKDVKESVK